MSDNVSKKIKDLRISKGMTLEEVGNIVGVGKSTVRKWENGMIQNMRRDKIAKLAFALGVSPSYLLGWEEEPSTPSRTLTPDEAALLDDYQRLNAEGKAEAQKQIKNLTKIEDYTKDTPLQAKKMA